MNPGYACQPRPDRITARTARNERIEASDRHEPIENAEAADPIDPTDSTEPIDPIESTEPLLAMQSSEFSDRTDHLELPADGSTRQRLGYGALGLVRSQMLVHQAHDGRAVAHGGGDTLDRVLAHVAGREDARHARLERQRLAVVLPGHGGVIEHGRGP